MYKTSIEYQGNIYRLRFESSRSTQNESLTCESNPVGIGAIFLDTFTNIEHPSLSDQLCMKSVSSIPVLENCVICGYTIGSAETFGDGFRSLYVALELVKNNRQLLKLFCFDTQSCRLSEHKQLVISKPLFTADRYPVFTHGPTLLWLYKHKFLFIISCIGDAGEQAFKIEKQTLNLLFAISIFSNFSDHLWILIATRTKEDIFFRKFCLDLCDGSVSISVNLRSSMFFPEDYKSIVTAISIKFSPKVQSSIICQKQECFQNTDILKQNSTCICTNAKQFIVFIGGAIKYCCSVPFPDVTDICELKQHQSQNISFLLKSVLGMALVQKNSTSLKIQVSEIWKKTLLSFFGDFQRKGKKLLILLPDDDSFQLGTVSFIMSEIANLGISAKKAVLPGLKESSGLMNTIMQDLSKRVSVGQAALTHVKETLQDKRRVLDSAILTLQNSTKTGKLDTKYQQLSMVDVALGYKTVASKSSSTSYSPETLIEPEYALELVAQWETSLKEDWILGMVIKNVSKCTVQNVTCTLVACEQILESKQLVFLHQESENQVEPLLQNSENTDSLIPPGTLVSLILAIKIPIISKDCLKIPVVLAWQVAVKEPFWQQTSKQVTLHVANLIDKRESHFEELSHVQQLLSFRVLQIPVSLLVESQHSNVKDLEEILKIPGTEKPVLLQHQAGNTYLFKAQASSLWGVNFTYAVQERTQAQMFVYCSTPNQLLLFVHWLYLSLHPDAIILPGQSSSTPPSGKCLWRCMGKELQFLVKNLGNCSREKSESGFASMREKYTHEQKQLEKKFEEYSFEEYSHFRNSLLCLEKVTDDYFRNLLL